MCMLSLPQAFLPAKVKLGPGTALDKDLLAKHKHHE